MPVTSSRPQTPVQGPVFSAQSLSSNDAPFILQFEKKLKFHVTYKNQQRILHGIADYSLWYNDEDSMATNLIIVKA